METGVRCANWHPVPRLLQVVNELILLVLVLDSHCFDAFDLRLSQHLRTDHDRHADLKDLQTDALAF